MEQFYMFLCDTCGFSKERPGMCVSCQTPLTMYSKETVANYQNYNRMEEALRSMRPYKWDV